jgi:hypothetical protein
LGFEAAFNQATPPAQDQEADYPNPDQIGYQANHHKGDTVLRQEGGGG